MVARVKKGDTVFVITGKDKGKKGKVIEILPKKGKVKVEGVAFVVKHRKARKSGETSSIKREEHFIDLSNVMPECPSTKNTCRVGSKVLENGKRNRISHRSKETF